jgi:hypothetical protein
LSPASLRGGIADAAFGPDIASMTARDEPQSQRAAELLIHHCSALKETEPRPSAYVRLERLLGGSLTRLLVGALAHRLR